VLGYNTDQSEILGNRIVKRLGVAADSKIQKLLLKLGVSSGVARSNISSFPEESSECEPITIVLSWAGFRDMAGRVLPACFV